MTDERPMVLEVVASGKRMKPDDPREVLRPATDEELAQWEFDEAERLKGNAMFRRMERNGLLAASDWTQLPDADLSAGAKAAWKKYRQVLRDNPEGPWPEPPEVAR